MARIIQNTILTLVICVMVLFFSTHGFSIFTTEGARRHNIQENPINIPRIPLLSSSGKEFYIQELQGKIILVDFIFTNCTGICPMMTQNFKELQKELQQSSLGELVVLLTISFDPARDTQQKLHTYAEAVRDESTAWIFATAKNEENLQELLNVFGIVVIDAQDGQYEHNGAIHLVNQSGKLAKIYDYESTALIMKDVNNAI